MAVAEQVQEITRDELIARVGALAPLVRERADEGERNRFVPEDVVRAMGETGLYRLLQPKRFGGLEYDIVTGIHCNLALAAADASTAWVAGIYMIHQWMIGLFPIEAQEDVWNDQPGAIAAGSYAPAGQCVRVDGGFRITGSWAYASGCDHADWGLMGTFLPPRDGDGKPEPGFVIAPRADFTIDDTWDTVGLAATGSKNMVCDGVFIPEHRHVTFAQLASGNAPGYQAHQSPIFRYPLLSLIAYVISTPALGCLEGAIEDFLEQTRARETRGAVVAGGAKVAQFQSVQMRIGHAAAALKAGRAMLFEQLEDSRRKVMDEGKLLDMADRQDNRITQAYTVQLALQGMEQLWGATGGAGIQRSQHVQRAWRDAHAVAHHVSFNWDALSSMYGQYLLGLEPQGQY